MNRSVFPIPVSSFRPFSFPSLFFWVAKGRRRVEEEEEKREDPPPPGDKRKKGASKTPLLPPRCLLFSQAARHGARQEEGFSMGIWMKILSIFTHRRAKGTSSSPCSSLQCQGNFLLLIRHAEVLYLVPRRFICSLLPEQKIPGIGLGRRRGEGEREDLTNVY